MTSHEFIEDLFLDFVDGCKLLNMGLQPHDVSAVSSFYALLHGTGEVTQAQANYIIKILKKYPNYLIKMNLDSGLLDNPKWKHPFRIIDHSKRIFVEQNNDGLFLCVQHPFSLKDSFEKTCVRYNKIGTNSWNPDTKIRTYDWYSVNPVLVREFGQANGYELSLEFLDLADQTEEIWNDAERYEKSVIEIDQKLMLINATESAERYFYSHATGNRYDDLLLAKNLGHRFNSSRSTNIIELISRENSNNFWIKQLDRVIELFDQIDGKICVVSSRDHVKSWVQDFVTKVEKTRHSLDGIRVCFREKNNDDPDFNSWIKNKNLGGDIASGRIFIFKEKPAKWLMENDQDVKIVILNGAFPPSSANAQHWLEQQSCVIYTGNLRPSLTKGKNIVEL